MKNGSLDDITAILAHAQGEKIVLLTSDAERLSLETAAVVQTAWREEIECNHDTYPLRFPTKAVRCIAWIIAMKPCS